MPNRQKPVDNTGEPLLSRYEETQARLQKIIDTGYKVISIWDRDFTKVFWDNPDFKNERCYVKNCAINIRDALYGC